MWKTLLAILKTVLTLARDLEENRKEIKEVNEKLYSLAAAVRSLSEKIDANVQLEEAKRRALLLQIENQLLKVTKERRTLSTRGSKVGSTKSKKK